MVMSYKDSERRVLERFNMAEAKIMAAEAERDAERKSLHKTKPVGFEVNNGKVYELREYEATVCPDVGIFRREIRNEMPQDLNLEQLFDAANSRNK